MKVLVTGASGMLGSDIADLFEEKGHEVVRLMGRSRLDLTSAEAVTACVTEVSTELVIHSAGARDVDALEEDERQGYLINTLTTRNIALAAEAAGADLLYTSTDSIYNGEKGRPYHEYDEPDPVNVYGKSKLKGEEEVRKYCRRFYIVRLGLLFGCKGRSENNMIRQAADKLRNGIAIDASVDQVCSPSYTKDIAAAVEWICRNRLYGEYVLANSGRASRYELMRELASLLGADPGLVRQASAGDIRKARRPKDTSFDSICCRASGVPELPDWKDALKRCLDELKGSA